MRGWLAHMSMKGNFLFITQTVATAGVEVMILTVACLLYVCLSGGKVEYISSVCVSVKCVHCLYHLGVCIIVEFIIFPVLCPYVQSAKYSLYYQKTDLITVHPCSAWSVSTSLARCCTVHPDIVNLSLAFNQQSNTSVRQIHTPPQPLAFSFTYC